MTTSYDKRLLKSAMTDDKQSQPTIFRWLVFPIAAVPLSPMAMVSTILDEYAPPPCDVPPPRNELPTEQVPPEKAAQTSRSKWIRFLAPKPALPLTASGSRQAFAGARSRREY